MYSTICFESGNGKSVSADVIINPDDLSLEVESITINKTYYPMFGVRWKRLHRICDIILKHVDIAEHVAEVLQDRRESYELSFID